MQKDENPGVADAFTAVAQKVWRGDLSLPPSKEKAEEQLLLFERIRLVEDVQAAWLLLTFCAATRANFGTVPREFTQDYAEMHNRSVTRCLEQILHMDDIPQHMWKSVSMPLSLEGLGVGGASRMCDAAH